MNNKEIQTAFYFGRIYQYYLDNSQEFNSGLISELSFLVPVSSNSENNVDFGKLKKLLVDKISKEDGIKVEISTKTLPARKGRRVIIKLG